MARLLKSTFILSVIGTLFAGSVTLRAYISPATEPGIFSCVGFKIFGWSPCPYGLAIFLALAIISGLMFYRPQIYYFKFLALLKGLALIGVAFSGWVGWRELVNPALTLGQSYWESFSIGQVPACVWGFLVFLAVGILSWRLKPMQA
jgi:hypothetical protein